MATQRFFQQVQCLSSDKEKSFLRKLPSFINYIIYNKYYPGRTTVLAFVSTALLYTLSLHI